MPTKTTTITHEPWCTEHDDDRATDTTSCGTKPTDLSDPVLVQGRSPMRVEVPPVARRAGAVVLNGSDQHVTDWGSEVHFAEHARPQLQRHRPVMRSGEVLHRTTGDLGDSGHDGVRCRVLVEPVNLEQVSQGVQTCHLSGGERRRDNR